MRLFNLLLLLLFVLSCGSEEKKTTRAMEPQPPPPPEKVSGCDKFNTNDDCFKAKEINFTVGYFMGSKGESQVFSLSKQDSSRIQITKLRSSKDLDDIKKRIIEERYFIPPASGDKNPSIEDLINFIQDDREGQGVGKTALEVKKDRQQAILDADEKRKSEDTEASKRLRERMLKEIETFPFVFDVSCVSLNEESKFDIEQCWAKLRPTLKITSEKKVIFNFTYIDFISGAVNAQLKLPKDFNFELTSNGQDSSKLLVAIIKNRVLKDEPNTGKVVFSTGKVITKMGQNITIIP